MNKFDYFLFAATQMARADMLQSNTSYGVKTSVASLVAPNLFPSTKNTSKPRRFVTGIEGGQ